MITTLTSLQDKFVNDPIFGKQFIEDSGLTQEFARYSSVGQEMDKNSINGRRNEIEALGSNLLFLYYKSLQRFLDPTDNQVNHSRYPLYVRVPFSEEIFKINTETRTISVPKEFVANGIGVTNDHLAEFLWFEVDRFYDVNDLMTSTIEIVWRNLGNSTIASESYRANPYAIYCDNEKVYFGWYITQTASSVAGTIEFAVRFYKTVDVTVDSITTSQIAFDLRTQPAKVTIKNGINIDFSRLNSDDGYDDIIRTRPIFSGIINNLDAAEPILTNTIAYGSYDVDEEDDGFSTFTISAISPDNAGITNIEQFKAAITFDWYFNNHLIHVVEPDDPEETTFTAYAEGMDEVRLADDLEASCTITNTQDGQTFTSVLRTNVPGKYRAYVGNKIIDTTVDNTGGVRYVQTSTAELEEANQIVITAQPTKAFYYIGDITTAGTPEVLDFDVDFETVNGSAAYKWYKDGNIVRSGELLPNTDVSFSPAANQDIGGIGHYKAVVSNVKNNMITTAETDEFTIINPPRVLQDTDIALDPIDNTTYKFRITVANAPIDCKYRYRAVLQRPGESNVISLIAGEISPNLKEIDLVALGVSPGRYTLTVYVAEITCPDEPNYARHAIDDNGKWAEAMDYSEATVPQT